MPKLEKDPHYPNLYRHPVTEIFYVRKFVAGRGQLYRSLRTKNRRKAITELESWVDLWLYPERFEQEQERERRKQALLFENIVEELRIVYESKAKATRVEFNHICDRYLLPFYRSTPIGEVGKRWKHYCAAQKMEKPNRKLQHDRKVLSILLHYAAEQEYLDAVPKLKLDAAEKTPRPGHVYSDEELAEILAAANPNLALLIDLKVSTGLRGVEVRTLRYDYIDWERAFLRIPAGVVKTREAKLVKLDRDIIKRLAARRLNSLSPYIFPHRFDAQRPATATDKTWQRLKKKLGIRGTQHHFRHTAATRLIQAGIPNKIVEKQLGMTSRVLDRTYLHAEEEQAEKLAEAMWKRRKQARRKTGEKLGRSGK